MITLFFTQNFKFIDIKNSNHSGVWKIGISGSLVNSRVHLCYDPREQPVVPQWQIALSQVGYLQTQTPGEPENQCSFLDEIR